eukprot:4081576-Alexandrium_andersonii.AAC.1
MKGSPTSADSERGTRTFRPADLLRAEIPHERCLRGGEGPTERVNEGGFRPSSPRGRAPWGVKPHQ